MDIQDNPTIQPHSPFELRGDYRIGDRDISIYGKIPPDTPIYGIIRILDDDNNFIAVGYEGWYGSTFYRCTKVPYCSDKTLVYLSIIDPKRWMR